jgi:hypothetical protein
MIKATAPGARNNLCIADSIKGEHCPHRGGVSRWAMKTVIM